MKSGAKAGNLTILSEAELDKIYESSLALLMDPGLVSDSDLFLTIFEKGGALVDRQKRTIRIPRQLVEWAVASAPKSFTLHGRGDPACSSNTAGSITAWEGPRNRSSGIGTRGRRASPARPT